MTPDVDRIYFLDRIGTLGIRLAKAQRANDKLLERIAELERQNEIMPELERQNSLFKAAICDCAPDKRGRHHTCCRTKLVLLNGGGDD